MMLSKLDLEIAAVQDKLDDLEQDDPRIPKLEKKLADLEARKQAESA